MYKRKHEEDISSPSGHHYKKHPKHEDRQNHDSLTTNTPSRRNASNPGSTSRTDDLKSDKMANLIKALDEALHEPDSTSLLSTVGEETITLCEQLRKALQDRQPDINQGPAAAINTPPSSQSQLQSNDSASNNVPKAISPLSLTPWVASEIPEVLPPLPAVLDPTLEASSFIHGAHAHKAHDLSYERQEWVGDAYIQLFSTLIISQTFPDRTPGESSYIRQLLVKNATLADYARKYGFPPRVKLPPEIQAMPEKDKTKIWGDVFEAYVAAVILSDPENGVGRCSAWLKDLWSMTIAKEIRAQERKGPRLVTPMWTLMGGTKPVDQVALPKAQLNPKERLAKAIASRGIKLTYKDAGKEKKDKKTNLPIFTVGVYLDGWGEKDKQLGFGRGHGKKDAGYKAAEMALANQKLMKVYMEKKKLFDAQLLLEEEAERQQTAA